MTNAELIARIQSALEAERQLPGLLAALESIAQDRAVYAPELQRIAREALDARLPRLEIRSPP